MRLLFCCFYVMFFSTYSMVGQDDEIKFRFSNVEFNRSAATMTADIEMKTSNSNQAVYSMNARFFYEDKFLEFKSFSDFQKGYDFVNKKPEPIIGGEKSARRMFNSEGKAGYINAGIELKKLSHLEEDQHADWTRLASVNFAMKDAAMDLPYFCPSLIWERSKSLEKSGLLIGSMGAAASAVKIDNLGNSECKTGLTSFENLNWKLESDLAPFGSPTKGGSCISKLILNQKKLTGSTYVIHQNSPNPFSEETNIRIESPKDAQVELSVYDVKGQLLMNQTHSVNQGDQEILVNAKELPAGTYMYQVIIDNYRSDYYKMIKLGK